MTRDEKPAVESTWSVLPRRHPFRQTTRVFPQGHLGLHILLRLTRLEGGHRGRGDPRDPS
jgi:hypothetical protein